MRRSSRRREYTSSSSNSDSPETEYDHRRRRKRQHERRTRPVVYRIGDKLEFKKSGRRRRRSRWVPVEVCAVHRGGMYGEITYSVWLFDSRRMVDYVHCGELRFNCHDDLERRRRDEEIARCGEEMRRINLKLDRQQRGGGFFRDRRMDTVGGQRGRSQRAARARFPRACSADRKKHMSARPDYQQERAMSVPPENTSWPAFFAEFAKAAYRSQRGDCNFIDDEQQLGDAEDEVIPMRRDQRNHDKRIYGNDDRQGRDTYRLINMNRGGNRIDDRIDFLGSDDESKPPNDNHIGGNRGTFDIKNRDVDGRDINVNLVVPRPPCKCQQNGGT